MKRLLTLTMFGAFLGLCMASGCGGSGSSAETCDGSNLMCGNCTGSACTCCPSSDPFWCVDGSGTAHCYDTMSDAQGACLSDVIHCG